MILLISALSLGLAHAQPHWKDRAEPQKLLEQGFHFSALDAQVRRLAAMANPESGEWELLEELALKTGVEALEDYDPKLLERFPVASVHFLLGQKAWRERRAPEARGWLMNVPKWHRYYPEARFLLADLPGEAMSEAWEEQCFVTADTRSREVNSLLLKRYYTVLAEDCRTLKGRKLYKAGKYREALEAYGLLDKRSYKWPYLLLEKAWAHYNLQDHNRVLGLLVTYKAPLLASYFSPEAEVLTALAYFRMCLYDDALLVIEQYYANYKPRTEALEALLSGHRDSQTYFFELMQMKPQERGHLHPFIAQLAMRIGQRPRFALDQATLMKLREEARQLERLAHSLPAGHQALPWIKQSLQQLKAVDENLVGRINYHAKRDMFAFISRVYALSEELFRLKLEIIARKKDLVYGAKRLISERGRGSFDEVRRSRFEAFWKFHGAFWADELGDFSFGLASNCQTVKREVPRE